MARKVVGLMQDGSILREAQVGSAAEAEQLSRGSGGVSGGGQEGVQEGVRRGSGGSWRPPLIAES